MSFLQGTLFAFTALVTACYGRTGFSRHNRTERPAADDPHTVNISPSLSSNSCSHCDARRPPLLLASRHMSLLVACLAVAMVLGPACTTHASAQPSMLVREALCSGCRIVIDTVARLDRAGSPRLSDQAVIAVAADGRIAALDAVLHPRRLLEFSRDGHFRRAVDISRIREPGIPVFDHLGQALIPEERTGHIWRITDGQVVDGSIGVDNVQSMAALPNGALVVNATSGVTESMRSALHLVPVNGPILSFDAYTDRILSPRERYRLLRWMWPSADDEFWSGHVGQYQIDLWSSNGHRRQSLIRRVPWFPPLAHAPTAGRVRPPVAHLTGVYEDNARLLFVLVSIADRRWRGFALPASTAADKGTYAGRSRHAHNAAFDTIIEVIDPARGVVIARYRDPSQLSWFVGPGYVVSYHGTSNATGVFSVLRLRLEGLSR